MKLSEGTPRGFAAGARCVRLVIDVGGGEFTRTALVTIRYSGDESPVEVVELSEAESDELLSIDLELDDDDDVRLRKVAHHTAFSQCQPRWKSMCRQARCSYQIH